MQTGLSLKDDLVSGRLDCPGTTSEQFVGKVPRSNFPRDGPGEACVFNIPTAAALAGHVGWGYEVGSDSYIFGATEDVNSSFTIPAGQPNGFWKRYGNPRRNA
jgi:hypothetical protein